jgi:hypothetical protein
LRTSAPVTVPGDCMSEKIEKSLLEIDFAALTSRKYTPSPAAWEDQVVYFLLVDRFSDGNERGGYCDNEGRAVTSGTTPLYAPENAIQRTSFLQRQSAEALFAGN